MHTAGIPGVRQDRVILPGQGTGVDRVSTDKPDEGARMVAELLERRGDTLSKKMAATVRSLVDRLQRAEPALKPEPLQQRYERMPKNEWFNAGHRSLGTTTGLPSCNEELSTDKPDEDMRLALEAADAIEHLETWLSRGVLQTWAAAIRSLVERVQRAEQAVEFDLRDPAHENCRNVEAQLKSRLECCEGAEARASRAEGVLRELREKVQELTPAIENAFLFAQVHGQRYLGPNWSKEMRTAKNLLDELDSQNHIAELESALAEVKRVLAKREDEWGSGQQIRELEAEPAQPSSEEPKR